MIKWIPWYPESPLPEPALVTKIGLPASSHKILSASESDADKPATVLNLLPVPVVPLVITPKAWSFNSSLKRILRGKYLSSLYSVFKLSVVIEAYSFKLVKTE